MRLGLDLRSVTDPEERLGLAIEADRLGLWALLTGGEPGTEIIDAAVLAQNSSNIHIAVQLDARSTHPHTLAEEVAILDQLSQRRALAVVDGSDEASDHVRRLLAGQIVDGTSLAPPPAQTAVPVWSLEATTCLEFTGDLDKDRLLLDRERDQNCTHLFVSWPGPLLTLARHLATRANGPDFPQIVADLADEIG